MDDRDVRERVARVEESLEAIEALPDGPRRTALDAVTALVELYGEAWARALGRLEREGSGSAAALAEDELVAHLLMIHGLHPRNVESRVRDALDAVGAAIDADGLEVELIALEEGVARLRFGGGAVPEGGVRDLIEQAILRAAPEIERIDVDRPASGDGNGPALVQIRGTRENGPPRAREAR